MRVTLLIFYIIFTLPGRASAGTLDLTGSWSTGVEAMVLYVLEDHTFIIRDADGQLQQGGWGLHDEDQYDVQLVSFTYGRASDTYRAQSDGQTIRFEDDGIDGHKIWVRYHDDALLVLNRALQEEFERSGLSAQRISTLIKAYVQAGGDPDKQIEGITFLQLALECALCQRSDTVKTLIDAGAEVNLRGDAYAFVPLHTAVERQDLEVIKLLVEHGAKINTPDNSFDTALHKAVLSDMEVNKRDSTEIIEYLLANDADMNLKNKQGQTAFELAKIRGSPELIQIMESYADP